MDPVLLLKSAVCAVAIVGAVVLAAMGKLEAREALEHSRWVLGFWVGGMTIASAVAKWSAAKNPIAALEALAAPLVKLEEAPATPRSPKQPPPLPAFLMAIGGVLFGCAVLAGLLTACTPAERKEAAAAARAAVPACEAGLTLLADAPELAPLCASIPEVEAALMELLDEQKRAGTEHPARATLHRRVAAKREGGHGAAAKP